MISGDSFEAADEVFAMNGNAAHDFNLAEQVMDFDNFSPFDTLFKDSYSWVSIAVFQFHIPFSALFLTDCVGELDHAAPTGPMDGDAFSFRGIRPKFN